MIEHCSVFWFLDWRNLRIFRKLSLLKQVHPLLRASYASKGSISALIYTLDMPKRILLLVVLSGKGWILGRAI
jgi:hypothetical protein